MIPRKAEIQEVVSLLEGGEHDTAEDLAKDLIKVVAGLLSDRDTFGVGIGLKTDDLRIPHGPYFGKSEAERVARQARERGLEAFVAPLIAPSRALSAEVEPKVCQCRHKKDQHHSSWGCCVTSRTTKERCPCQTFTP